MAREQCTVFGHEACERAFIFSPPTDRLCSGAAIVPEFPYFATSRVHSPLKSSYKLLCPPDYCYSKVVNCFKIVFLLAICAVFGVALLLSKPTQVASCTPIPLQEPETGNHGWLVWSNDSYKSFTPEQTGYCIEVGWEPVGATLDSAGNAVFPAESSGIYIKTSEFTSKQLLLANNETSIRVLYPTHLAPEEVAAYLKTITAVFTDVLTLYSDFETTNLSGHTVFITVGIAGDANDIETSVYPTPTKDLTVFGRNLNHRRGEELFIHAVMHLFNRHFTEGLAYQQNQAPVPAADWQELESSWAEIAFLSDD